MVPRFCNTPYFRKKDFYGVTWEHCTEVLEEFKTTEFAHYPMKCSDLLLCEELERGKRVLENGFERISVMESDTRNRILRRILNLKNYMFTVGSTPSLIDAITGKSARFCNHSFEPSSEHSTMTVGCSTSEVVLVTAPVDLPTGTEVTVGDTWGVHNDTPSIVCECEILSFSRLFVVNQ